MKMYLISDNIDTQTGMRLAGVEGVVLHEKEEVLAALSGVLKNPDIGILLITEKIGHLIADEIRDIKMNCHIPLVVEIPDRHGSSRAKDSITQYVKEAIGLKI
ncbi:ATP synthase subunit F [Clostridiales bacterium COT073_COT-073]|nr:ATP synthase subunit F [Clostridiales bacterium COT073_COT-073]